MQTKSLIDDLNIGERTLSDVSTHEWRGWLFEQLKSENIGSVLMQVRPFYDGAVWNESLVLSWLQLLDGLKGVQSDWSVLTHRCPELLEADFMHRLYSSDKLEAAETSGYIPPDKSSIGELLLTLMTQAVVHVGTCTHCSGAP